MTVFLAVNATALPPLRSLDSLGSCTAPVVLPLICHAKAQREGNTSAPVDRRRVDPVRHVLVGPVPASTHQSSGHRV